MSAMRIIRSVGKNKHKSFFIYLRGRQYNTSMIEASLIESPWNKVTLDLFNWSSSISAMETMSSKLPLNCFIFIVFEIDEFFQEYLEQSMLIHFYIENPVWRESELSSLQNFNRLLRCRNWQIDQHGLDRKKRMNFLHLNERHFRIKSFCSDLPV